MKFVDRIVTSLMFFAIATALMLTVALHSLHFGIQCRPRILTNRTRVLTNLCRIKKDNEAEAWTLSSLINQSDTWASSSLRKQLESSIQSGLIKQSQIWSDWDPWAIGNDPDTIVAYVQSSAVNTYRRYLIRKTWGNKCLRYGTYRIQPLFVIGLHHSHIKHPESVLDLYWENVKHGDILYLSDVLDTYNNLTQKEIRGKRWIADHVTAARHVLKVDDDVFINTPLWFVEAELLDANFYAPNCQNNACLVCKVWRSNKFCSGSGYLMTKATLDLLVRGTRKVPFYRRDDRYFTGMVAERYNITRIDKTWRYYFLYHRGNFEKKRLPLAPDFLLAHNLSVTEWERTWYNAIHNL